MNSQVVQDKLKKDGELIRKKLIGLDDIMKAMQIFTTYIEFKHGDEDLLNDIGYMRLTLLRNARAYREKRETILSMIDKK